ncbi:MAG: tryptophan 7-halogenase [Chthoniobacterales bacterium]|nr:tryptophan 7-halogenase [Chthoniobacterales bacterium]
MSPKSEIEIVIIGGGPAGSTAATILAQAGRRVLVLEKEKFPRFHVGESLLPYNRRIFDGIGVWPKLEAAGFMKKRGAQFLMGNGSVALRLNFSKGSFNKYHEAIQVERSKFDEILLNHAREAGAEVREEALVLGCQVHAEDVTVRYREAGGGEREVRSKFLVDASGLANFTANRKALREDYPGHRKIAIFGHFAQVDMPQGDEKGDILVVRRENSWFWLIPLEDNKTSVGLVMDCAEFQKSGRDISATFHEAVRDTPAVRDRFAHAKALDVLHVARDFSYRNRSFVEPRLVRVGDASGFIDPVFSSGVMLAMAGACQGALAVDEALSQGKGMSDGMRAYEKTNRKSLDLYWEFIESFYTRSFTQLFFQPTHRLRLVCAISSVLVGSTELSFAIRWRLRVFFLLARLNRWVPIAQRIPVG